MARGAAKGSARELFQVGDTDAVFKHSVVAALGSLCYKLVVVFRQDRCPKVALHEEVSGQTWACQHAVPCHATEVRTAATLHSSAAETLPCKQVCLWSV